MIVETKCVFKLLSGLNKDLEEVKGPILSTKPLTSLWEAFFGVKNKESRGKIMLGGSQPNASSIPSLDSFALTRCDESLADRVFADNKPHKARPFCDHCRRCGHIWESCWKFMGDHQIRIQVETPKIQHQTKIWCLFLPVHQLPLGCLLIQQRPTRYPPETYPTTTAHRRNH